MFRSTTKNSPPSYFLAIFHRNVVLLYIPFYNKGKLYVIMEKFEVNFIINEYFRVCCSLFSSLWSIIMVKKNSPVAAASATYRKAVNAIGDALGVEPQHGDTPSDDLEIYADLIEEKSKERAIEWYRRGLKRGFINACDAMLRGNLQLKQKILILNTKSNKTSEISVKVKFRGEDWESKTFVFSADELEFK